MAEEKLGFPHGNKLKLYCAGHGNEIMAGYENKLSQELLNIIMMNAMEYGMRFMGITSKIP